MQKRDRPHATTFVGPGFVDALRDEADDQSASLLIADNDLSPSQAYNIEKRSQRRVIDRSELILDIFVAHARSREAKVAVELAQLEYALPRLKRLWTHLERQKGGIGLRGPGETQIETDRRLVKRRIADLRTVLKKIQERKRRQVQARSDVFKIALVGYTNAGKSTLLNTLSGLEQKVADQLFATLDTKTTHVNIEHNLDILMTDTVGFIREIPHHLIASFHATLEEVLTADLLLHVVDVSHPDPDQHIEAVHKVLATIGADDRPEQLVFNKVDTVPNHLHIAHLKRRYPTALFVSAESGEGIDAVRARLAERVHDTMENVSLEFSVAHGKAIAFIRARAQVLDESFDDELVRYQLRITARDLGTLRGYLNEPPS